VITNTDRAASFLAKVVDGGGKRDTVKSARVNGYTLRYFGGN
jgi:hypothetical protein